MRATSSKRSKGTKHMNLKFQGQSLTGTISNDGPYSSGLRHAVINGEMQCKSGMNFGSRYLHINAMDKATTTFKTLIAAVDCSKCKAELTKKSEARKAEKADA
jgi:hypothetical protein